MAGSTGLLVILLVAIVSTQAKSRSKPKDDDYGIGYKSNSFRDIYDTYSDIDPWAYIPDVSDEKWDNYDEFDKGVPRDDNDDATWDEYQQWLQSFTKETDPSDEDIGSWEDDDSWEDDGNWSDDLSAEDDDGNWSDDLSTEDDDSWEDDLSTEDDDSWEDDLSAEDDDSWEDETLQDDEWKPHPDSWDKLNNHNKKGAREYDDYDDYDDYDEEYDDYDYESEESSEEQSAPNKKWNWSSGSLSKEDDWEEYLDDDWKEDEDYDYDEDYDEDYSDEDYSDEDYSDEDYEYDVSSFYAEDLEDTFLGMLDMNDYKGASFGVARNGKLVFAEGYGQIGERNVHSSTLLPISSMSKTLTAVAVMKLVEDGYVTMSDTVFGADGLLSAFEPADPASIDPRLYNITVEHLLRHAGGWDESKGPVFDPMLNELYLKRGERVPDIAATMNSHGALNQYNIIQYMMSQPLDFAPGSKYRTSNFGYNLLGRVIEQVTATPYEEFMKHEILAPAGMIHTRIGPRYDDKEILYAGADDTKEMNSQALHKVVLPQILDSSLGWYSNIHDLHRFFKCLLEPSVCTLLRPATLQYMQQKPPHPNPWHEDSWRAVGFHAMDNGVIWQDSELYDNDVIFYHRSAPQSKFFNEVNVTLIALTTNNRYKRLRSAMEKYAEEVADWPVDMHDVALDELCMAELIEPADDVLVKFALSEHHIRPYMSALKIHGFYPDWVHGHTWLGISDFVVIARKSTQPQDLDFEFYMSSDVHNFYNYVANREEEGYQVAIVQTYKSFSHDGQAAHFALLRRNLPLQNTALWQVNVPLADYLSDLGSFTQKGYSVQVQSVEQHGKDEYVSYIMTPSQRPDGDYLAYHSLTQDQLEFLVKSQSLEQYHLTYLDTYRNDKQPMFSAVFHKGAPVKWLLQTDVQEEELAEQAVIWHKQGYTPIVIVGYELHDHGLRYTGLWTKP